MFDANVKEMIRHLCFKDIKCRKDCGRALTVMECIIEDTTTVFSGMLSSILAPGEVRPGHMIFAPLRTNLMAPLSTCSLGRMCGSA